MCAMLLAIEVSVYDAVEAEKILRFALFKEMPGTLATSEWFDKWTVKFHS